MQSSGVVPERERGFVVIAALLLIAAAVPRLWAVWFDQGIFWPDEIFQSVEQAHRLVFGYGITPWEFRAGARSWVFPGLIAGLLKLGSWLGMDSGRSLILLVKTCMALLSLLTLYMSMRLAQALAGTRAALLAGAFGGFFSVSLLLSSRAYSELATAPVLLGSYLLSRSTSRAKLLAAGALAGLAIGMRYQSGVIACGLLGILVLERRWTAARWFAAGAGGVGLLVGLLDWFTWGAPFYALKKYLYFNLKKSGDKFGRYPVTYYVKVAWTAIGPSVLILAAGLAWSVRLAPKLWLLVVGYIAMHCVIPHKEFRFLMPVVPMALALSGAGIADLCARTRRADWLAAGISLVTALGMSYAATQLTWEKLGFPSDRGARSPWHSGEGINRLLWSAGQRDDVCGLMVTGESFGWIGAYSYFHRDVDLYPGTSDSEQHSANYLIAPTGAAVPPGYELIEHARDASLLRRAGACAKAPDDYHRELPY